MLEPVMEFSGRAGAGGQCDISCKYSFFFCFMVSSPVKCTDDKFGPLFLPLEANRSDFWHLPSLKYKLSWRFFPFDSPETVAVPWLSNGSVLIDILDIFVWPCAPSCRRQKKNILAVLFFCFHHFEAIDCWGSRVFMMLLLRPADCLAWFKHFISC